KSHGDKGKRHEAFYVPVNIAAKEFCPFKNVIISLPEGTQKATFSSIFMDFERILEVFNTTRHENQNPIIVIPALLGSGWGLLRADEVAQAAFAAVHQEYLSYHNSPFTVVFACNGNAQAYNSFVAESKRYNINNVMVT